MGLGTLNAQRLGGSPKQRFLRWKMLRSFLNLCLKAEQARKTWPGKRQRLNRKHQRDGGVEQSKQHRVCNFAALASWCRAAPRELPASGPFGRANKPQASWPHVTTPHFLPSPSLQRVYTHTSKDARSAACMARTSAATPSSATHASSSGPKPNGVIGGSPGRLSSHVHHWTASPWCCC
jgi:hypothetical protein